MRTILLGFTLTSIALAGAAAQAQISLDPSSQVVTCESQPGRFKQRALTGLGDANRMTGRIRLVTPAPSSRWVPAAGFLFNGPNDRNAGVQIALAPERPDLMLVGLRLPGRPELIQLGTLPADRWINLSASLDATGHLVVTVATRTFRRRVRLQGPIEPVMHCNSGTFAFVLEPGLALADPPPE